MDVVQLFHFLEGVNSIYLDIYPATIAKFCTIGKDRPWGPVSIENGVFPILS
jgi:hypothetical protein